MSEQACKRCQRPIEAGQARCACGCALPKNNLAVTHGGRRRPLSPQEARTSELFARWAADLGGLDALSVGQQEVLAGIVASVFIRNAAERYLAQSRAPLTSDRAKRALEMFFRAHEAVLRGAPAGSGGLAKRRRIRLGGLPGSTPTRARAGTASECCEDACALTGNEGARCDRGPGVIIASAPAGWGAARERGPSNLGPARRSLRTIRERQDRERDSEMSKDVLWRVSGHGRNGAEGVSVTRAETTQLGLFFGSRVSAVRASELDAKVYQAGTWHIKPFARS